MYPKGKNQPGQRCHMAGGNFENLEGGQAVMIQGLLMDRIGFATNLPKICWPGTGPPDPRSTGSMTSNRYRCWCAAPGKILDTTQHLMKNVRSVFIPLRFFRHIGYFHLNIAGFGHHGSKETQLLNLLSQIVPKWQQLSFCLKCQVSKLRVINFIEFKSIFKCLNPLVSLKIYLLCASCELLLTGNSCLFVSSINCPNPETQCV